MAEEKYVPRLKTKYNDEVKQLMQDKFQYKNVNMGVGEAATDTKAIDGAVRDLRVITGQQPMVTRARKSIASFRQRAGMPIGAEVDFDSVDHTRGMDITIVTTAKTDEEAKALLDAFGFPFKK